MVSHHVHLKLDILTRSESSVQFRGFVWCYCPNTFYSVRLLAPRWRATPGRLSTTAYSIYSQLISVFEGLLSHPQPKGLFKLRFILDRHWRMIWNSGPLTNLTWKELVLLREKIKIIINVKSHTTVNYDMFKKLDIITFLTTRINLLFYLFFTVVPSNTCVSFL